MTSSVYLAKDIGNTVDRCACQERTEIIDIITKQNSLLLSAVSLLSTQLSDTTSLHTIILLICFITALLVIIEVHGIPHFKVNRNDVSLLSKQE